MSWHWVGPGRTPFFMPGGGPPTIASTMPWMAPRSAALSAPVGAPVPCRALTMLSSLGWMNPGGSTYSVPCTSAVYPPCARAAAAACAAAAMSSGASAWVAASVRSSKIRGELTMLASSGCASGTLMTSMRNSAEFGSWSGASFEQPESSFGERTPADPET